ncbi:MAG: hypothetical protein COU11_00605 [Candidatus Harrisonbacteria bacterium CG10_big_fil_rev_8_21_14_0_10_49_15]|uniref:Uncharacterized protein n=1 Tax=Candidatus Harrisonbacteria bacterium CG10_big_fil_rev_8_21_14_0_10_49_15 TaxID=1974587 RepID=A0A2H0ULX1_9BACT|nr:MAG: hypothetical protein COU11_00605 [Candidatus Harrisonbacteria bacterium CG10_big_fil_rev_8_21_14_0_10_49_15]
MTTQNSPVSVVRVDELTSIAVLQFEQIRVGFLIWTDDKKHNASVQFYVPGEPKRRVPWSYEVPNLAIYEPGFECDTSVVCLCCYRPEAETSGEGQKLWHAWMEKIHATVREQSIDALFGRNLDMHHCGFYEAMAGWRTLAELLGQMKEDTEEIYDFRTRFAQFLAELGVAQCFLDGYDRDRLRRYSIVSVDDHDNKFWANEVR